MPTVTIDRRGLNVGGERRWIVSGSIDPTSLPNEHWNDRLAAAAAAGLNGVLVPAVWSAHEPRQGVFDFEGDRDIARFVRLAGEHGLMVILRPGPFVGEGRDRGGIPSWVDAGADDDGRALPLRSSAPAFLGACSAWFRTLAKELSGLQATDGGPIVLVQNEHRWFCADPEQAGAYLNELHRYLREGGIAVPIVSANNLYANGEGETEGWNGHEDLLATFRQLRGVRPEQACLALDFELGRPRVWGQGSSAPSPAQAVNELAQALGGGAQFNLSPFAGGSRFGFDGGRLPFSRDAYAAQSNDDGSPLAEDGSASATLDALRPLLLFASSFERTLAGIDWASGGAVAAPGGGSETIVHAPGENGSAVFVLRDPNAKTTKGLKRELLLPDGRTLEVDLKDSPAVWCLLDAAIGPNSRVDYANASPFWSGPRALALTAPAGSEASFSINGSAGVATASRGKTPTVIEHEGVTVVVLSTEQAAACARTEEGLLIGAAREGVARDGWKRWTLLRADGTVDNGTWEQTKKTAARRTLSGWTSASTREYITGESHRYAVIDGAATLDALGASTGYGWVRWNLSSTSARKPKALLPESGDRVLLYAKERLVEVYGLAPGATEDAFAFPLAKGKQTIVALVDNLGRPSGGWSDAQKKGIWGPVYEVKAFKAGKATLRGADPLRPLSFRTPLTRVHSEETTHAPRATWEFTHRRKSPILLRLGALPEGVSGLLIVNDEVIEAIDEGSRGDIVLRDDTLRAGKNVVQFAPLSDPEETLAALNANASFFECVTDLTAKGEWAFARWEVPANGAFTDEVVEDDGLPVWRRATFPAQAGGEALAFDPKGLTKGQVYLNGRHVGRYFTATRGGKAVEGQSGVYLPAAWLNTDAPNEITIFDEHGADASKCKVVPFAKLRG